MPPGMRQALWGAFCGGGWVYGPLAGYKSLPGPSAGLSKGRLT